MRRGLHFCILRKKERLTRLELEKESQYGAGESAAGCGKRRPLLELSAASTERERRQSVESKRETEDASERARLMGLVFRQ